MMRLVLNWQNNPMRAGHYARNPFTGGTVNTKLLWYDLALGPLTRAVEYLRWQVLLWLVGFGRRVCEREIQLAARTTYDRNTRFGRFVDRLSPFTWGGYKNVRLRRVLYALRYPMTKQRFWSLALVRRWVYGIAPRPALGRYTDWDPQRSLKAEWFDRRTEYAGETTGDSDTYLWAALFAEIDVPWSLKPETWVLTVDSRGFVEARQDDAVARYSEIERAYNAFDDAAFE